MQTCIKYACRCGQYPGCCCCWQKRLQYNRIIADVITIANILPCLVCCRLPVEKTVLLCGVNGSGKTSLLYYFMLGKYMQQAEPTKGQDSVTWNLLDSLSLSLFVSVCLLSLSIFLSLPPSLSRALSLSPFSLCVAAIQLFVSLFPTCLRLQQRAMHLQQMANI